MKTATAYVFLLAIGFAALGSTWAGDLEPPASPAPTMVTLQEIFDAVRNHTPAAAHLLRTGQTVCSDTSNTPIPCAGTGQDGEYQAGAWADPRFTDNGDGTVSDNLTGLIWLQQADCFGTLDWVDALADANTLADGSCGLTDGSVPGDWRVPNFKEFLSLIDYGQFTPAIPAGHPFLGVPTLLDYYWTSTTSHDSTDFAWTVIPAIGSVNSSYKGGGHTFWPVRRGQ